MSWIEFLPIRKVSDLGILGDIRSHLPNDKPYTVPYGIVEDFGSAMHTKVHEGTHGINSEIRNKYRNEFGICNCSYLLKDRAFIHSEPTTLTLKDVAKLVPHELRGSTYQLYLVQQQRYWNDRPLYIIDELSAYLNGTKSCVEYFSKELDTVYSCKCFLEFIGYLAIVVKEIESEELSSFIQTIYNESLDIISSIFHMKYDVDPLYTQLSIIEKYIDRKSDYIMV